MTDEFPHVAGVEHRYVDAGGLRVHLAEAGDPAAPPLLMLHGWPQHWYMWHQLIPALAPSFHLLIPDLRGFGWTEAPGAGYDCETFARDQVALLDELGIERVKLIGHDWGGWTAMLLGLLHPDRIERMIVCNATHPWPRARPALLLEAWRGWYTWINATPGIGTRSLRNGWISRNILSHGNVGSPFDEAEIELYVSSFRDPARAKAVSHLYRYYQRVVREGAMGRWREDRISVPTRIIFGERDRYVTPRFLHGFEGHADDMELELVPDSGHFIVNEKPELVAERALAFLGWSTSTTNGNE